VFADEAIGVSCPLPGEFPSATMPSALRVVPVGDPMLDGAMPGDWKSMAMGFSRARNPP
jgi:hypothetical protein